MGLVYRYSKFLTLLYIGKKEHLNSEFLDKLTNYYFKVDIVEDEFDAINSFQNLRYNLILIDSHLDNINTDVMVYFIKQTKKNQPIFILNGDENSFYDSKFIEIISTISNKELLTQKLLDYNERITSRNRIREELLQNRLKMLIESKDEKNLFVYSLSNKSSNENSNLLAWISICENFIKVNSSFEIIITEILEKRINENRISKLITILNSYYQIFSLISETKDIAYFILQKIKLFKDLCPHSQSCSDLIVYMYLELIYFQYILFFRNELKNINYFKVCLFNSFNLVENKIKIHSV